MLNYGRSIMNTLENRKVIYLAIFINPDDIQRLIESQGEKLPKEVKNMHCTFKYQPSEEEIKNFSKLLGKDIELKVVGYCSDGKNSGYEIELSPEQDSVYTNSHSVNNEKAVPTVERTTPHITTSLGIGEKPVNTGFLQFSRKGFQPFIVHGKAGFFTSRMKEGNVETSEIIYEPVLVESENINKTKNHIK